VATTLLTIGTNPGANGSNEHPVTAQQFVNTAPLQVRRSNW
jgi:hypothetical protein